MAKRPNKLSAGIKTAAKALTTVWEETTKTIVNLKKFAENDTIGHRFFCPGYEPLPYAPSNLNPIASGQTYGVGIPTSLPRFNFGASGGTPLSLFLEEQARRQIHVIIYFQGRIGRDLGFRASCRGIQLVLQVYSRTVYHCCTRIIFLPRYCHRGL